MSWATSRPSSPAVSSAATSPSLSPTSMASTPILAAVDTIMAQGEASSRARIREIPDGAYENEAFLDDDSLGTEPVPIRVKVIVEGDEMTIDFSGLAEQVPGPVNSGYFGGGVTAARVAFKYLIAPREPANEGVFRPLKLILPEGKLLSARHGAPMSNYSTPFPDRHRYGDPLSGGRAPAPRHRRPFRHSLGIHDPRQLGRRKAISRPRQRPRRLGRGRRTRRRRAVPDHGARRYAAHSDGIAGIPVTVPRPLRSPCERIPADPGSSAAG